MSPSILAFPRHRWLGAKYAQIRSYTAAREPLFLHSLRLHSPRCGCGTRSHLINTHFFHIWASSRDGTHGHIEFSIISFGRALKPNQRPLAIRAPSFTLFSGLQYSLCDVSYANVIQGASIFSKTLSGRQGSTLKCSEDGRYFVSRLL